MLLHYLNCFIVVMLTAILIHESFGEIRKKRSLNEPNLADTVDAFFDIGSVQDFENNFSNLRYMPVLENPKKRHAHALKIRPDFKSRRIKNLLKGRLISLHAPNRKKRQIIKTWNQILNRKKLKPLSHFPENALNPGRLMSHKILTRHHHPPLFKLLKKDSNKCKRGLIEDSCVEAVTITNKRPLEFQIAMKDRPDSDKPVIKMKKPPRKGQITTTTEKIIPLTEAPEPRTFQKKKDEPRKFHHAVYTTVSSQEAKGTVEDDLLEPTTEDDSDTTTAGPSATTEESCNTTTCPSTTTEESCNTTTCPSTTTEDSCSAATPCSSPTTEDSCSTTSNSLYPSATVYPLTTACPPTTKTPEKPQVILVNITTTEAEGHVWPESYAKPVHKVVRNLQTFGNYENVKGAVHLEQAGGNYRDKKPKVRMYNLLVNTKRRSIIPPKLEKYFGINHKVKEFKKSTRKKRRKQVKKNFKTSSSEIVEKRKNEIKKNVQNPLNRKLSKFSVSKLLYKKNKPYILKRSSANHNLLNKEILPKDLISYPKKQSYKSSAASLLSRPETHKLIRKSQETIRNQNEDTHTFGDIQPKKAVRNPKENFEKGRKVRKSREARQNRDFLKHTKLQSLREMMGNSREQLQKFKEVKILKTASQKHKEDLQKHEKAKRSKELLLRNHREDFQNPKKTMQNSREQLQKHKEVKILKTASQNHKEDLQEHEKVKRSKELFQNGEENLRRSKQVIKSKRMVKSHRNDPKAHKIHVILQETAQTHEGDKKGRREIMRSKEIIQNRREDLRGEKVHIRRLKETLQNNEADIRKHEQNRKVGEVPQKRDNVLKPEKALLSRITGSKKALQTQNEIKNVRANLDEQKLMKSKEIGQNNVENLQQHTKKRSEHVKKLSELKKVIISKKAVQNHTSRKRMKEKPQEHKEMKRSHKMIQDHHDNMQKRNLLKRSNNITKHFKHIQKHKEVEGQRKIVQNHKKSMQEHKMKIPEEIARNRREDSEEHTEPPHEISLVELTEPADECNATTTEPQQEFEGEEESESTKETEDDEEESEVNTVDYHSSTLAQNPLHINLPTVSPNDTGDDGSIEYYYLQQMYPSTTFEEESDQDEATEVGNVEMTEDQLFDVEDDFAPITETTEGTMESPVEEISHTTEVAVSEHENAQTEKEISVEEISTEMESELAEETVYDSEDELSHITESVETEHTESSIEEITSHEEEQTEIFSENDIEINTESTHSEEKVLETTESSIETISKELAEEPLFDSEVEFTEITESTSLADTEMESYTEESVASEEVFEDSEITEGPIFESEEEFTEITESVKPIGQVTEYEYTTHENEENAEENLETESHGENVEETSEENSETEQPAEDLDEVGAEENGKEITTEESLHSEESLEETQQTEESHAGNAKPEEVSTESPIATEVYSEGSIEFEEPTEAVTETEEISGAEETAENEAPAEEILETEVSTERSSETAEIEEPAEENTEIEEPSAGIPEAEEPAEELAGTEESVEEVGETHKANEEVPEAGESSEEVIENEESTEEITQIEHHKGTEVPTEHVTDIEGSTEEVEKTSEEAPSAEESSEEMIESEESTKEIAQIEHHKGTEAPTEHATNTEESVEEIEKTSEEASEEMIENEESTKEIAQIEHHKGTEVPTEHATNIEESVEEIAKTSEEPPRAEESTEEVIENEESTKEIAQIEHHKGTEAPTEYAAENEGPTEKVQETEEPNVHEATEEHTKPQENVEIYQFKEPTEKGGEVLENLTDFEQIVEEYTEEENNAVTETEGYVTETEYPETEEYTFKFTASESAEEQHTTSIHAESTTEEVATTEMKQPSVASPGTETATKETTLTEVSTNILTSAATEHSTAVTSTTTESTTVKHITTTTTQSTKTSATEFPDIIEDENEIETMELPTESTELEQITKEKEEGETATEEKLKHKNLKSGSSADESDELIKNGENQTESEEYVTEALTEVESVTEKTTPCNCNKTDDEDVRKDLPIKNNAIHLSSQCTLSDYLSKNHCICSVKKMLQDLNDDMKDIKSASHSYQYSCSRFIKIEPGIVIGNNSESKLTRRRRMGDFIEGYFWKRESRVGRDIDYLLDKEVDIEDNENVTYAGLGSEVNIPCVSNGVDEDEYDSETTYIWSAKSNCPNNEGNNFHKGSSLVIDKVKPEDSNNYTCTEMQNNSQPYNRRKEYVHQLVVVAIPTYSLTVTVVLNASGQCLPGDLEVLNLYYPVVLKDLLCNDNTKICSISVEKPQCIRFDAEDVISLHATLKSVSLTKMFPNLNDQTCDLWCQSKVYSTVVAILLKNLASVTNLPVFFRLSFRHAHLTPIHYEKGDKLNAFSNSITTLCPAGFGIYENPKLCFACEPYSFNAGGEMKCNSCPRGTYQPGSGARSCLPCSSPFDDVTCILPSAMAEMSRKYYLIPVVSMIIILLIIACCVFGSRINGRRKLKPLSKTRISEHKKQPPEPPPIDF